MGSGSLTGGKVELRSSMTTGFKAFFASKVLLATILLCNAQVVTNGQVRTQIERAVALTHSGLTTNDTYQLQGSVNFSNWSNVGAAFVATNSTQVQFLKAAGNFQYFRVSTATPPGDFESPTTLKGKNLDLEEATNVNNQAKFFFRSTATHPQTQQVITYYSYVSDNPEELGTWIYEKTGARTAVLHCFPDWPMDPKPANHDVLLSFTNATSGTFSGHVLGRPLVGTFFFYTADPPPVD
jgi:hypothetical protein